MNAFKTQLRGYLFSLLCAFITVVLVFKVFGFFWEDWQQFVVYAGYGLVCSPPTFEAVFQDLYFLQLPVLAVISTWFDKVPVFGFWNLLVIILYLSLWFNLTIRTLNRIIGDRPISIIVCSHLFVWAVIGVSLVYVNVTRDSILLVSVSVLLYLDYYLQEAKRKPFLLLLFLLGISMRITSGVVALSAMTVLCLLVSRDFVRTFRLLKFHWILSLFCLFLFKGYYPGAYIPDRAMENYEYARMGRAMVPLSEMKSAADSARYQAVVGFYLVTDTVQVNEAFIRKVLDMSKFQEIGISKENFSNLDGALVPLVEECKPLIIVFYLLLLAMLWGCPGRVFINVILFNVYCWLVILLLALKINMQMHFFMPWVSMLFGGSLFLCLTSIRNLARWQKFMAIILLGVMVVEVSFELNEWSETEKAANAQGYALLKKLELLAKDKEVVLWGHAPQLVTGILARNEMAVLKNCVDLCNYHVLFYQFGQKSCLKKFGVSPLNWKGMNLALNKNSDRLSFVMDDRPAIFLGSYYKRVYNLEFNLVKDTPVNELAPGWFAYHLETEAQIGQ